MTWLEFIKSLPTMVIRLVGAVEKTADRLDEIADHKVEIKQMRERQDNNENLLKVLQIKTDQQAADMARLTALLESGIGHK